MTAKRFPLRCAALGLGDVVAMYRRHADQARARALTFQSDRHRRLTRMLADELDATADYFERRDRGEPRRAFR